ncbi:MAG TPA: GntR family transcriptional regulator [Gemmatimonadaceae bacterium]|jgi:GntR family transcriptional repressor for pyruvate dehydrogenase complex
MIDADGTNQAFDPVTRERLSDRLASRIGRSIERGVYRAGDRLPSIDAMARAFRVAPGSVRVALMKLEMLRVIEVRHGLGVFVLDRG